MGTILAFGHDIGITNSLGRPKVQTVSPPPPNFGLEPKAPIVFRINFTTLVYFRITKSQN